MEGIDVVSILKLGLPGVVFLLSLLSYRLLSVEQKRESVRKNVLTSIRYFMYINLVLAILTGLSPVLESRYVTKSQTFTATAKRVADIAQGEAAVCNGTNYASRYLLVNDEKTGSLVQVFAKSVIPCGKDTVIELNPKDAENLGWHSSVANGEVKVVTALPGYKFVI